MSDALIQTISERVAFLRSVVPRAIELVYERGRVVSHERRSSNTNIVRELDGFNGFNFKLETGMTMMGGNSLDVYRVEEGRVKHVLDIYWQESTFSTDRCNVRLIDSNLVWQLALVETLKHKKRILAKMKADRAREEKAKVKEREKADEELRLQQVAERLKV